MKRHVLTITLALVLAVAGTVGVLAYVNGAAARAVAGLKAVTVLVAQREIPAGTQAGAAQQDGALRGEILPARSVSPDAVGAITGDLGSLVMSSDVMPGQVLLRSMLVPAAQVSGGLAIPGSMVAVTIPLCLPQAVAGYVHAGSQVAIFDTVSSQSMNAQESCSQSGESHQAQVSGIVDTRVVLPRVQVLSVGTGGSGQGGSASGSGAGAGAGSQAQGSVLVTLAVDQSDAERVIQLTETGLPYLALLTPASQTGFDTTTQPLFQK
jgi:pilus assembly protein CpaB